MINKLKVITSINREVMDLEQDEVNNVLRLLDSHINEPQVAAEKVSEYLSKTLPVGVEADLILSFIN